MSLPILNAGQVINDYHLSSTRQLTHDSRVTNMTKDVFVVRLDDLTDLNRDIIALDRSYQRQQVQ
jgi:hypothetical protein